MVVLIDTNILMDFIAKRQPFFVDSRAIIKLCTDN